MEFSVYRQVLIKSIAHMQSIVERRAPLPIMMNVRIEAKEDLVITAANVDLELVERVQADITLPGKITVPVHLLYDILRKLPEEAEVKIRQLNEQQLIVSSGKAKFTLSTLSADSFPTMSGANLSTKFTMTTGELARMMDKTKFAMPTDDTRYHLAGIFFHITEDGKNKLLTAVATDSQRMAVCSAAAPAGSEAMPSVILPRRVIGELSKLLADAEVDDVVVELSDTKARFTLGAAVLTTKLVDAQYPNYRVVIPKNNDKLAVFGRLPFVEMIDRVSVTSTERTKSVVLNFSTGKLVANTSAPEAGAAVEEMDIEYNNAEQFQIVFNVRFLLDIATQIDADKMQISMMDSLSPTIMQGKDKGSDCIYILMPQRV
ncbi:MAG: DNA polymerase III subunit beta [Rickettsiales bacterium]|jgi:DNA polymerase-3 subunit beta|nr:DNA polymerase III subunit beta [Rickettsiales bacterium]